MFSIKLMFSVSILSLAVVSLCTAQVAKSQSTSSSVSGTEKQPNGRSYTTSGGAIDPNSYMNQAFAHKPPIDLLHLLPIILIVAIIPLVLPLILQLFAGALTPLNFAHGKRKREINFHPNEQMSDILLSIIQKVGDSFTKFH